MDFQGGQKRKQRVPTQVLEQQKMRTYFDDVPEDIKEILSKEWGQRKKETLPSATERGIKINVGDSFNQVFEFTLPPGYYNMVSGITSTKDISPEFSDVGDLCTQLIDELSETERRHGGTPWFASNVCDWDSKYAKKVEANIRVRDAIINSCIKNRITLVGGETANLGDQVRKNGMSWMFTLLSKYDDLANLKNEGVSFDELLNQELSSTFGYIPDYMNYEIVNVNGIPLLYVKKAANFVMTADGPGSKAILGYDGRILDTLAMTCDDAMRDGAFPLIASIGVDAENTAGKQQFIDSLIRAGKDYLMPMIGCVYRKTDDVNTHIMNGVVLSEVKGKSAHIGKEIKPGVYLVILPEEQRSNGITTQRNISEETFGEDWHRIKASDAFDILNDSDHLDGKYSGIKLANGNRTLGELVAKPSTPYFRIDSRMPDELLDKVKFRINVSSGGLFGKTRRLLKPLGLGAEYSDVFKAPDLILLLQMASQLGSKGVIPDEVAYYTWGCGTGAVIGTTDPDSICKYYNDNKIGAEFGGVVTPYQEIKIASRCLDAHMSGKEYMWIRHKHADKPLG